MDGREQIQQIHTRRGRDQVSIGTSPLDGAASSLGDVGAVSGQQVFGADFRSPWMRDRVTLSLEAQIAMMEQRATARLTLADLGYTNRTNVLELRPGIYVKVEPTGCYRLAYKE
ncbi:MAG: hypothetical protein V2A78_06420 [bacterium]